MSQSLCKGCEQFWANHPHYLFDTTLCLRSIMILSSNKVLPSDPRGPIELTTHHYPYPFLPYSPSFWPRKARVFHYIKAFQPSRDAKYKGQLSIYGGKKKREVGKPSSDMHSSLLHSSIANSLSNVRYWNPLPLSDFRCGKRMMLNLRRVEGNNTSSGKESTSSPWYSIMNILRE